MNPFLRFSRRRLDRLYTPFGPRTLYNSAAYCTRCGSCMQACPLYQLTAQETYSPRGRNQLLRLALEQKINPNAQDPVLLELLQTCTLCGRCTQVCPGRVPTAEHVLEMRRALNLQVLPKILFSFLQWRETRPRLFKKLAHVSLFLRRIYALKFLRFSGLTLFPGLRWLNHLDRILPKRTPNLQRLLRKEKVSTTAKNPTLIYLPSLETEFLLPHLALKILKTAQKKDSVITWSNTATGLFSYVYGDLRQSRRTLRRLIKRHARLANGHLSLLTDSLDVYNFLNRAPQLFAGNPHWEEQARQLADSVQFVTDIFPKKLTLPPQQNNPALLECGTILDRQSPPVKQAEAILYTLFGKNFVECLYTDAGAPAFGYAFARGNRADQIGLKTIEKIQRAQIKTVFTLSGLTALELAYLFKHVSPAVRVQHLADII